MEYTIDKDRHTFILFIFFFLFFEPKMAVFVILFNQQLRSYNIMVRLTVN